MWEPKAKEGATGESEERCEAKLGSGACLGNGKAAHEVCARLAWPAALLPHSLPKRRANTLLGSKALHNYCLFKLMPALVSSTFYKKVAMLSPLDSDEAK